MGGDTNSADAPLVREFRWRRHGAGYCLNQECEAYLKAAFINNVDKFWCAKCKEKGISKIDTFFVKNNCPVYKEARIEFNFDPTKNKFKSLAIVRDEDLPDSANVFTMCSALYNTDKRALRIAEQLLGNLLLVEDPADVKFMYEDLLYMDEPMDVYKARLGMVSENWELVEAKLKGVV